MRMWRWVECGRSEMKNGLDMGKEMRLYKSEIGIRGQCTDVCTILWLEGRHC